MLILFYCLFFYCYWHSQRTGTCSTHALHTYFNTHYYGSKLAELKRLRFNFFLGFVLFLIIVYIRSINTKPCEDKTHTFSKRFKLFCYFQKSLLNCNWAIILNRSHRIIGERIFSIKLREIVTKQFSDNEPLLAKTHLHCHCLG